MKLTSVFILPIALLAFASCNREAVNPASSPMGKNTSASQKSKTLCTCGGYTLQQDGNGDFSCPGGDGCSKVVICPCAVLPYDPGNGSTDVTFTMSNYNTFLTALNNNTLTTYFNSDQWQHVFPALIDHDDILRDLQSGASTVDEKSYDTGDKMYLVIPASLKGTSYGADQVQLPLSIPAAVFAE